MKEPRTLVLSEAREDFLTALKADGMTASTIRQYSRTIREMQEFLGDVPLDKITTEDVRRFLAEYRQTHSAKTVYNAWVALRSFWRYLEGRGYKNIVRILRAPRYPRVMIHIPSVDDIRKLLDACDYTAPSKGKRKGFRMPRPTAKRDRALVMLLVDTGMRAGEVGQLRVGDIDLDTGRIVVRRGKGGKGRTVFASSATLKALEDYWETRDISPDSPAFITRNGRALTTNEISHLIRNLGKRAGISVHPHALRHFFATQFLRNGGDALTLKRLLGHSTLSMVEYYVSLIDDDLQDAHKRASPLKSILS